MDRIKKFLFQNLDPECLDKAYGRSTDLNEQMSGVFWTMVTFMLAEYVFKIIVFMSVAWNL